MIVNHVTIKYVVCFPDLAADILENHSLVTVLDFCVAVGFQM